MDSTSATPRLITTSTCARLLGLSEAGVRALERRGHLPAIRTENGFRLFDRQQVEGLARQRAERKEQAR